MMITMMTIFNDDDKDDLTNYLALSGLTFYGRYQSQPKIVFQGGLD